MDRALRRRLGEVLNSVVFVIIAGSTAYGCHQLREKRNNGEFTPFLDDEEMMAKDRQSLMLTHKALADRLAPYTNTAAATTGLKVEDDLPNNPKVLSVEATTASVDTAPSRADIRAPTSPTNQNGGQASTSAGLLSGIAKIFTG